jgi:hypothetical protein
LRKPDSSFIKIEEVLPPKTEEIKKIHKETKEDKL